MPQNNNYQLPRCEYYSRYATSNGMPNSQHWNTYHRSLYKRNPEAKTTEYAFHPTNAKERVTEASKTGTYYTPFHFKGYKKAVKQKPQAVAVVYPVNSYDEFLAYQRRVCGYIVTEIKKKQPLLIANADNDYTCVLVKFPKPAKVKEVDWVNFIILHFVAIANYLSEERGLNCELVRRSGFGHLRPSVCETAPSLRINVGFIPKVYADVLVAAMDMTYNLLCTAKRDVFNHPPSTSKHLEQVLSNYNKARQLDEEKQVSIQDTLWNCFWAKFDARGRSLIVQVMRQEIMAEWVINQLLDEFKRQGKGKALASLLETSSIMMAPWEAVLKCLTFNSAKQTLSIKAPATLLPSYKWPMQAAVINDSDFHAIITRLYAVFDKKDAIKGPAMVLENLHEDLESASREMTFNPDKMPCEDGYGSDSDAEGEIEIDGIAHPIFAKKMITATGMRAIQIIFASIKKYWQESSSLNFRNLKIKTDYMYYETNDALKKHPIPVKVTSINELAANSYTLCFYDLNHCNTMQIKTPGLLDVIDNKFPIAVLDTTSSSNARMAESLKKIMANHTNINTVIMVSSGLKNEQAGSDFNPYGTVRIFSRSKNELNAIYQHLCEQDVKVNYHHPAESHLLRKNAKLRGLTPTNLSIFASIPTEAKPGGPSSIITKMQNKI